MYSLSLVNPYRLGGGGAYIRSSVFMDVVILVFFNYLFSFRFSINLCMEKMNIFLSLSSPRKFTVYIPLASQTLAILKSFSTHRVCLSVRPSVGPKLIALLVNLGMFKFLYSF